ncbi:MAG: ABC transporter substrate-binding protein [Candidatus Aerophobetes bacterium]|nr:ABC transporter substrate-binding protein [Candidatus Aerophobetes bacterium]
MFSKVKSVGLIGLLIFAVMLIGAVPLAQASPPKEIKIGIIYPLSGGLAATGKTMKEGVELAADIINHKHPELGIPIAEWEGIPNLGGAKIKVIFADHRSDPGLGADLAKRLIKDEKVAGILGCYNSSVTKTASRVAERYKVPFLNGTSSSPLLTTRGFEWFWRTSPHDTIFTKDLFDLLDGMVEGKARGVGAISKEEIKKLAVAMEDTEYGSAARELVDKFASERGYEVAESFLYAHEAPDLTSESLRLITSKADCYLFASYLADSILYIKTLKAMGAAPNIIWGQDAGFIIPEFAETLGADINGIITRAVFAPTLAKVKPIAAKINKMYREKTGYDFSGASARAFTGLHTWAYVLNSAGSTDPEALKKAFNELCIPAEEHIMPWGDIEFGSIFPGETHQNLGGTGIIAQHQWHEEEGKLTLEVIYPFEYASADMIYPFPGWK